MASFSSSYNISTSSESENENGNNIKFDAINKIDFNKTSSIFKTSLTSSLSRQTSNNSLRYIKKLKRKNNPHGLERRKYSTTPYSLTALKTNHSKNISNNKRNLHNFKEKKTSTTIDIDKDFDNAFESSLDSDFSDLKYFKLISKNNKNNTSSTSNESSQSKSYLNRQIIKSPTINSFNNNEKNINYLDLSTSANSLDFSQVNIDFVDIKKRSNNEFNLDDFSSDSLSDGVLRKDDSDRNSQLYLSPDMNNSISRLKSVSPKQLLLNASLEIGDEPLSQKPLNVTISVPNLTSDDFENEQNQIVNDIEKPTINSFNNNEKNINYLDLSTSASSFDFSQLNIDFVNIKKRSNNEFNLDEFSSHYSLSERVFRKDNSSRNSQLYLTTDMNNSISRIKSVSPKPLLLNASLGIGDEPLSQKPLNVTISVPDLTSDDFENEQNQIVNDIDKQEQNIINNRHNRINKSKSISDTVDSDEQEPNSSSIIKSIEEKSVSSKPHCNHCNRSCKLKNVAKNTDHINSEIKEKNEKKTKQNKSKHLNNVLLSNTLDVLRIKKSSKNNNKKKSNQHSTNKTEDIGLEYDTSKDNYMVELPNGAIVPAFLSTLNPKYVKKVCACGITTSEIPPSWSESFHNILHQNIHKLFFKGVLSDNDPINVKQNDLSYRILILCMNNYNDEHTKKFIKDIDNFVSLEYGICNTGIQSHKDSTIFLALLPNFKVIGYLEVEPIKKAYKFKQDEPVSEITVSVKFGVSKIWVLVKYRNKNVDINLLEVLRKKENLKKEDLAFSLDGCLGVEFIQEYIGNTNILLYN